MQIAEEHTPSMHVTTHAQNALSSYLINHLLHPKFIISNNQHITHAMASLHPQFPIAVTSLVFLFLIFLPSKAVSQSEDIPITPDPTIADCTPRLLPLTPCAPFVQGVARSPPPSCCDNLRQLYLQQPGCLCIFLNDTNLSSFPINSTLALQLPALCHIHVKISACSGIPEVPSSSPAFQVPLGAHNNSAKGKHINSSVAASPMVQVTPRPVIMGLGLGRSAGRKLKPERLLVLLMTLAATFLTKATHSVWL